MKDAFIYTLGLFVVLLCWRTLVLTLRIENLERRVGLRRGPECVPSTQQQPWWKER